MNNNLPVKAGNEVDLLKQQDEHQFIIAKLNIESNLKNQKEVREHFGALERQQRRNGTIIILVFLVLFFAFGFYALSLDKENFLADVLKVVIGAFGGGGLGYAVGLSRRRPPPVNKTNE